MVRNRDVVFPLRCLWEFRRRRRVGGAGADRIKWSQCEDLIVALIRLHSSFRAGCIRINLLLTLTDVDFSLWANRQPRRRIG